MLDSRKIKCSHYTRDTNAFPKGYCVTGILAKHRNWDLHYENDEGQTEEIICERYGHMIVDCFWHKIENIDMEGK